MYMTTSAHLEPAEDRQLEPRTFSLRDLILAVKVEVLSKGLHQFRLCLKQSIVNGVAAGPCAVAANLGWLEAEERYKV